MSYSIGQYLPISIVPFTVYYASDRAASKNKYQSGQYYKTGNYRIVNVYYDHNGQAYQNRQSARDVPLYAVNDPDGDYTIGWVREDEVMNKVATISSLSNMTVDGSGTVTLRDYSDSMTYQAQVGIGSTIIKTFTINRNPYTYTFTASEQNAIIARATNSTSLTASLYLTSIDGTGKSLGETFRNFSIHLGNRANPPTINQVRVTSSELIDGKIYTGARFTATIDATANNGASISSYSLDIGGRTFNSRTATTSLDGGGRIAITATVTDSRGQTTTKTTYVTIHERPSVSINQQVADRYSETAARIIIVGNVDRNFIKSLSYNISFYDSRNQKAGADTTGTATVNTDGQFTINRIKSGLDKNKAYTVRVSLRSSDGVVINLVLSLGTSEVPQSLGRHGTGVGVRFDNDDPTNLQVGKGGIRSEGAIYIGNMSITSMINQAVSRAVSSIKPPEPSQPQPTGITIDQAFAGANYGRLVINGNMMIKWGKATVTGQTYTINFNTYGGAFREAPFVLLSAESGRWEFATPSLTTTTPTGFTASTVNAANGQALSTSHTINYLALGRK